MRTLVFGVEQYFVFLPVAANVENVFTRCPIRLMNTDRQRALNK